MLCCQQLNHELLLYYFPETWWWYNKQDDVMAMTIEATYGKAGYDHWVTDVEQRDFGVALAKTIATYLIVEGSSNLPKDYKDNRKRRDSIIYQPGFEEKSKSGDTIHKLGLPE